MYSTKYKLFEKGLRTVLLNISYLKKYLQTIKHYFEHTSPASYLSPLFSLTYKIKSLSKYDSYLLDLLG